MKQQRYPVHIKFNTGLNRLGFRGNDLEWIGEQLKGKDVLEIRSLFSHLAATDDPGEREFTLGQLKKFEAVVKDWEARFENQPFKHLLNTSGVFNYPEAQWDMVRTGIGLYGYSNDPETDALLRPVSRLRTRISQIHKIEPGEWVGYNKGYRAQDYRITATLPIGHADGIGRQYGQGKGCVYIGGKPAAILGNVCMDMTMVDITTIPCKEGDEVVFFGDGISAEGLAEKANTISYELLAGISQRVPRVFIGV
jgi:alanine racemase